MIKIKLNNIFKYKFKNKMVSYAGMAYADCLAGVQACIEYEKRVEQELKKIHL